MPSTETVPVRGSLRNKSVRSRSKEATRANVLESFNELNESRLSASTRTNDRDKLSRLNLEAAANDRQQGGLGSEERTSDALESSKHANVRASRVAEVDVVELDVAFAVLELVAVGVLSVDLGLGVEEMDNIGGGASGLAHVGNVVEDWEREVALELDDGSEGRVRRTISGLDRTKDDAGSEGGVRTCAGGNGRMHARDHGDEERLSCELAVDEESGSVPVRRKKGLARVPNVAERERTNQKIKAMTQKVRACESEYQALATIAVWLDSRCGASR